VLCGPNVAPSLGPVLGGVLTDLAGRRWIFWFLSITSGASLATICLLLPETARKVVGNGSIPAKGVNQDLLSKFRGRPSQIVVTEHDQPKRKLHVPNPMACLYIIFYKDTASILLTNAIFYMIYCCIQASLSSSFISIYHYQELEAGLIYLPFGFGCALASYGSGDNSFSHLFASSSWLMFRL
jgi:MFS family permease